MKQSAYKTYEELPLFLNAEMVAKVLGVSPSSGYELMHEVDFPVLKVGNRMLVVYPERNQILSRARFVPGGVVVLDGRQPACVLRLARRRSGSGINSNFSLDAPLVPKEKFIQWVKEHTQGGTM